MPVPNTRQPQAPRRLLRDIVADRVQGAILDGTLRAGERLQDEELIDWLGVSRTPIREGITRLAEIGLVEMEANRFTRVRVPDPRDYIDTKVTVSGTAELVARWAAPLIGDRRASAFVSQLHHAQNLDLNHHAFSLMVLKVTRELAIITENSTLRRMVDTTWPMAEFLHVTDRTFHIWDRCAGTEQLEKVFLNRDSECFSAAFRDLARGCSSRTPAASAGGARVTTLEIPLQG